jgi:hypothetical protein
MSITNINGVKIEAKSNRHAWNTVAAALDCILLSDEAFRERCLSVTGSLRRNLSKTDVFTADQAERLDRAYDFLENVDRDRDRAERGVRILVLLSGEMHKAYLPEVL